MREATAARSRNVTCEAGLEVAGEHVDEGEITSTMLPEDKKHLPRLTEVTARRASFAADVGDTGGQLRSRANP